MRIIIGITIIVVSIYFIDFHEYNKPDCKTAEDFLERSGTLIFEQKMAENKGTTTLTTDQISRMINMDRRIRQVESNQASEDDYAAACEALNEIIDQI